MSRLLYTSHLETLQLYLSKQQGMVSVFQIQWKLASLGQGVSTVDQTLRFSCDVQGSGVEGPSLYLR